MAGKAGSDSGRESVSERGKIEERSEREREREREREEG